MTNSSTRIARGSDGAGFARRIYRRSPIRWVRNIVWGHRDLTETDVMLCSYPRSGSTWMRFLMYGLTLGADASFATIAQHVPLVGRHQRARAALPDGGRFIKTHEPYMDRYRRVIHIVRDPRDVAVSYWYFLQRIGKVEMRSDDDEAESFDHFIDAFLAGRIDAFTTWQTHLLSYLAAAEAHPERIMRIRFEDLRADTEDGLRQIAGFLGHEITADDVARAIEQGSLDRMREAEDTAVTTESTRFATQGRKTGIRVVRSGEVGGWRARLTAEQSRKFSVFADGMKRLGYPDE